MFSRLNACKLKTSSTDKVVTIARREICVLLLGWSVVILLIGIVFIHLFVLEEKQRILSRIGPLKLLKGRVIHVSKYVIGIVANSEENLTVPLVGGLEYCVTLKRYIAENKTHKVYPINVYMEGHSVERNRYTIFFYKNEATRHPLFYNKDLKKQSKKFEAFQKYSKYTDDNAYSISLMFTGPYHISSISYAGINRYPRYIPPNYQFVILTDYLTSFYFEDMVEHFFEHSLPLRIVFIYTFECFRDMFVETFRSPKDEPCHLFQRWAKLTNKTGRGPGSKITFAPMSFNTYNWMRNSSFEIVDTFFGVFQQVPPAYTHALVYSSHTLELAKTSDYYARFLGIRDYYQVNCFERRP